MRRRWVNDPYDGCIRGPVRPNGGCFPRPVGPFEGIYNFDTNF